MYSCEQPLPVDLADVILGHIAKRKKASKQWYSAELFSPSRAHIVSLIESALPNQTGLYFVYLKSQNQTVAKISSYEHACRFIQDNVLSWGQVFFASLDLKGGGAVDLSEENGIDGGALAFWLWGNTVPPVMDFVQSSNGKWKRLESD